MIASEKGLTDIVQALLVAGADRSIAQGVMIIIFNNK
jgi:hypothetical protein